MDDVMIDRLSEIAEEHNLEEAAFVGFCDDQHITADEAEDAVKDFEDAYIGEFSSEEAFAEYWVMDEMGATVESIVLRHIDWSDVWHCELRHDFYEVDGHYFRNI